jgi:hypothetical protein
MCARQPHLTGRKPPLDPLSLKSSTVLHGEVERYRKGPRKVLGTVGRFLLYWEQAGTGVWRQVLSLPGMPMAKVSHAKQ